MSIKIIKAGTRISIDGVLVTIKNDTEVYVSGDDEDRLPESILRR